MKRRIAGVAGAVSLLTAIGCARQDEPAPVTPESLRVRAVEAEYTTTRSRDVFPVAVSPVAGATVRVVADDGGVHAETTDADGWAYFGAVHPKTEATVDVGVDPGWSRGGPGVALFAWAQTRVVMPLPPSRPTELRQDASAVTSELAQLRGRITEWVPSGLGERSEARVRWRHHDGLLPGPTAGINDLYAHSGLDASSGEIECTCTDDSEEVQMCVDEAVTDTTDDKTIGDCCPEDAILCNDPGSFAAGASGISFFAPPGLLEVGWAERVTDYESGGRFVETGHLYYDPAFALPPEGLDGVSLDPVTESAQNLCPGLPRNAPEAGSMGFAIDGVSRRYLSKPLNGRLEVWLHLASPLGLDIPVLLGDLWPRDKIYSSSTTRHVVAIPYPYRLDGPLAGFSYGYRLVATAFGDGETGVDYEAQAARTVPEGITDPCRIRVHLDAGDTSFDMPTTTQPLLHGAEARIQWQRGPTAPVRRVELRTADGTLVAQAWLLDPTETRIPLGSGVTRRWSFPVGDYVLSYRLIEVRPRDGASQTLLRPDVQLADRIGTYFEQQHPFHVE